jgi:hypothetical protein
LLAFQATLSRFELKTPFPTVSTKLSSPIA